MNGVAGGDIAADVGSSSSLILTQTPTVDRPMTELGTHAPKPLHDTTIADVSEPKAQEDSEKEGEEEGSELELDKEQLLKHRTSTLPIIYAKLTLCLESGIIIFNILSGKLQKKARLEVLLDDGYWPAFSTIKARSTHAQWQHVGEGFIKELDFGRIWLRLNENAEGDKDDIVAEWKGSAKTFLQATLVSWIDLISPRLNLVHAQDRPQSFFLSDVEDEDKISTVEIEARYVPVPVKLEPRESINSTWLYPTVGMSLTMYPDQGVLRVELIEGRDLIAADRGGMTLHACHCSPMTRCSR